MDAEYDILASSPSFRIPDPTSKAPFALSYAVI